MGNHDLGCRIHSLYAEYETTVVTGSVATVDRTDDTDCVCLGGETCDQTGKITGFFTFRHIGEYIGGACFCTGSECKGDIGVFVSHLKHQVLILGTVSDDDIVTLCNILACCGTCVNGFHFLAVAVLDASWQCCLGLEDAVMHSLTPSFVIDSVFDDQGNLDNIRFGFGNRGSFFASVCKSYGAYHGKAQDNCQ